MVRLYINEVVLSTLFGIFMGPHFANAFDPRSWGPHTNIITLEVTRVVLAVGLFAIGVELPKSYMAQHARGLLVMVVPTMAFGWAVVAGVIRGLFPQLSFVSALVIAATLTPTDPIVAQTIVGGQYAIKNVKKELRHIISAESAANDGLAYPFLSISIYLLTEPTTRSAIGKWFLIGWLYQVILGTVLGAVLGHIFSVLMKYSHEKNLTDRKSYIAQYLALALLCIGISKTIGSDDLLTAFAAGTAVSWDGYFNEQVGHIIPADNKPSEGNSILHEEHEESGNEESFSSVLDLVLNCACFIYIGAWLPFTTYNMPEFGVSPWRLIVLFVAILVLRRIPPLLLLFRWIPEITSWRDALFSGHFDGLSIPFFSFGRQVGSATTTLASRTLSLTVSLTRTFTSRSGPQVPDWTFSARRQPPSSFAADATAVNSTVDIEALGNESGERVHVTVEERAGKITEQGQSFGALSDREERTVASGEGILIEGGSRVQLKSVRFPADE
ncbi:hypothetical protein HWV62_19891 [Athelia sp. TMB]|nr:hypothetical protein HWV62_19891 [Athelia sp. TMB]